MIRYKYLIKGVVQGVGFRPFVYKIATKYNLAGFVKNSANGVIIKVQGDIKNIKAFEKELTSNPPPLAQINSITKSKQKLQLESSFIIKSSQDGIKTTLISADIKVCKKCLEDINNPNSRFYRYFATNCTNCGPRYTIIKTLPYDRKNSAMSEFKMCKECLDDYNNPNSRRYHAQPIACKNCGPKLSLITKEKIYSQEEINIYKEVASLIKKGKIGAIKGIGGFHIVCDATNSNTIKKLRQYKNRPTKPFAIMAKDITSIKKFASINKKEQEILESMAAPIVILDLKKNNYISSLVAPNIDKVGVFLPYTPFYFLLFNYLDTPIIATSANLGGEPIISDIKDLKELSFLDFIVDFNRKIINRIDDSVVQVINNKLQILRLARGYAPKNIILPTKSNKNILAFGANQKSTICVAFENNLIISPYIGDLDNIKIINFYKEVINNFKRFYDFKPNILVADLHPNYESSKIANSFAKDFNIPLIKTQHHLAHLNSIKAEFNIDSNYIGFIFDGTGLGIDNKLWGGEIFINNKRTYYFKPIKLIGGEKAIKEPRRVALSLLFEKYDFNEIINIDLELIKSFKKEELKTLYLMWQKNLNSPLSSSVGRLFDGVAALNNLIYYQTYEAEAGLITQKVVNKKNLNINNSFLYTIKNSQIVIEWDFFDKDLVTKFYNTLVKIIIDLTTTNNLTPIFSGGVFQNSKLLNFIINELHKKKIKYFFNNTIPINDSGISAGQIVSLL